MPIDTLKSKRRLVEEFGTDDRQAEGIVDLIACFEERALTRSDRESTELRLDRQNVQVSQVEESLSVQREQLASSFGTVKLRMPNSRTP